MAWVSGKQVGNRIGTLSKLMAALLKIHTQRQSIRVLGQVQMLRPRKEKQR